ncbi:MAG: hypothetical protein ACFE9I_05410 [Candidatus Hermodarchaeota archaeon]
MSKSNFTRAYIQRIDDIQQTTVNISLLKIKDLENYPYLLIIQSNIENALKISIYPIKKEKIIKVTFFGFNVSTQFFDEISRFLQNFQVIHTSGVLLIQEQLLYECYLNLNLKDIKANDLKKSLDKIKNIFKDIKIEEIGIKKSINN